jgi:cytochrome c oxidase subunit 4
MSDHAPATAHSYEHEHVSAWTYLSVFAGLCVLTAISFWLGNSGLKQHSPRAAWAGMMAVSCGKAMLVILFFMHLKWEANWKYVLTIPAMMMSVFLVCMLIPDVGLRRQKYSEERLVRAAQVREADAPADPQAAPGHP